MMRSLVAALSLLAAGLSAVAGPDILRETSPDGFSYRRVHLAESQVQVMQLLWRDGTPLTLPGMAALAAFAPAMMHEGPKGEKRGEINELMRDLQASFRFGVSTDTASLSLNAPPQHFPATVEVLKRFLENPGFPEKRLETMRRERIASATTALGNGETIANQLRLRLLLEEGPHLEFMRVIPSHYERGSVADIAAWRRAVLARDNLILVSAGPMDAASVGAAVDHLVAGLPQNAQRQDPPQLRFKSVGRRIVFEKKDVAQTIIVAFGPTRIGGGIERFKGDFAISRLGGGAQGRLFVALREKLGATYGASASIEQLSLHDRALTIRSSVSHDKARAVIDEIASQYQRWHESGISEAEFQAIRSQSSSRWAESLKQPGSVASFVGFAELQGITGTTFDSYLADRQALTRDEVNAFIKERFPAWPLGMVIVAPSADGLGADCVIKALDEFEKCR